MARTLVRGLPMGQRVRSKVFDFAYSVAGPLFRGSVHYEYWRRARAACTPDGRLDETLQLVSAHAQTSFTLSVSEDPAVSIIVPTYGRADLTRKCLAALAVYPPRCSFEVIVSEDASPDQDSDEIGAIAGVRYCRNQTNIGFLRNCNGAAKLARAPYLLFLNNDTVGLPGWLDALLEVLQEDDGVGAVGSKLLFPDGRLQEAGGIVWADGSAYNYGRSDSAVLPEYNFRRSTDYCSGAALMIRRTLFEELGGFDLAYAPAYYEDADLCFRVRSVGYEVLYQPESEVVHLEGASHGTDIGFGMKACQVRNALVFADRWSDVLNKEHCKHGEYLPLAAGRRGAHSSILVVDRYPPRPDRDAGSRSVFDLIKAMRAAGWHVSLWPETLYGDPEAVRPLQRMGVEVAYGNALAGRFAEWFRERASAFAHVVVNRVPLDSCVLDVPIEAGVPITYYGHDIHFRRLALQADQLPGSVSESEIVAMKAAEMRIWEKVHTVVYPSDDEVALVRATVPSVRTRRIPLYAFREFKSPRSKPLGATGLFVGSAGHVPNRDAVNWLAEVIVPRIRKIRPDFRLMVVGGGFEGVPMVDGLTVAGAVSDAELARLYEECDLALVPLRFGAGLKGKVIEAMAQGVPVVTTACGVEGLDALRAAVFEDDTAEGLAGAVVELLSSPVRYAHYSRCGLEVVRRYFHEGAMLDFVAETFGKAGAGSGVG